MTDVIKDSNYYSRKWRAENKERARENNRRWAAENRERQAELSRLSRRRDPARTLLRSAKARAKHRGMEFSLTVEWLEQVLEPMRCSVTKVQLDWEDRARRPSLDRVDCSRGYTEDNVRVTSWIFNRARGDFSDEELLELIVRPLSEEK